MNVKKCGFVEFECLKNGKNGSSYVEKAYMPLCNTQQRALALCYRFCTILVQPHIPQYKIRFSSMHLLLLKLLNNHD